MKLVTYTDKQGYKHKVLMHPDDTDPEMGIPQNPPDLDELDWNKIKRDLHNELVELDIITKQDLNKGLTSAILGAIKPELIRLYKQEANNA